MVRAVNDPADDLRAGRAPVPAASAAARHLRDRVGEANALNDLGGRGAV